MQYDTPAELNRAGEERNKTEKPGKWVTLKREDMSERDMRVSERGIEIVGD